jgi:mRNA interferase HigB
MLVLNVAALDKFARKHRDAQPSLARWREAAEAAQWNSLHDVRQTFSSADGISLKNIVVTVFNVKGNEYRLITAIAYPLQIVQVLFVMTHAEYTKPHWKDRL